MVTTLHHHIRVLLSFLQLHIPVIVHKIVSLPVYSMPYHNIKNRATLHIEHRAQYAMKQTEDYSRKANLDSDPLRSSSPATVSPRDYVSFHALSYLISRSCSTT